METSKLIADLRKLIEEDIFRHSGNYTKENQISYLLEAIAQHFLINYEEQRSHVSSILALYEDYTDHVLPILLQFFMKRIEKLKMLTIILLDLKIWEGDWNSESNKNEYLGFLEANLNQGQAIRLSEATPITVSAKKAGIYLGIINKMISHAARQKSFDADDVNSLAIQLWMARRLAITLDRKELFYLIVNLFFDGLNIQQHYQLARDFSEECLICAYQDELPEYGYFLSFRVFADSSNATAALHYAIISFNAFQKKGTIIDFVLKNLYWIGIKFCRNIHLTPFAVRLFKQRPINVHYHAHEKNKIYHAYLSSLLFTKESNLPEEVLNFIEKEKEEIIKGGPFEVLPWLSILMNIKKIYSGHEYDEEQMYLYMGLFKQIAGESRWKTLQDSLFGSLAETQKLLKASLTKLLQSRNQADFVTDNKEALVISHRNLAESFKEENVEAYLLSMILQSDFSMVFKEKEVNTLRLVKQDFEQQLFEENYIAPQQLLKVVTSLPNSSLLWLGADDRNIYPLYHDGNRYLFIKETSFSLANVQQFYRAAYKNLPHNDRLVGGLISEKRVEDYAKETAELKAQVSFLELPIQPSKPLLVIKDISISSFPHNLLTTQEGFIVQSVPVTNITSLEWLFENRNRSNQNSFSSAIWIPTESQDMPICMMHSRMEEALEKYHVVQYLSIIPPLPLSAVVNIVTAHGDERISTFPAFYFGNSNTRFSIHGFDNIIGRGQVLVLFVCHAGSQVSDFFRNQISTAIKQFLRSGYSSIIAPFWALHINIPPLWLPEFLEALNTGEDVGTATFRANQKVSLVYNTPKAYACLHLYGNPFIKVN